MELTVDYKMSHHYKMSLNWTEATENLAQDRGAMVDRALRVTNESSVSRDNKIP